jgi:acid phosphatase type 7
MKTRIAPHVTTLVILTALAGSAGAIEIVAGPYLQAPSETSMTVMWITDRPCTSWVKFGQNDALDRKAFHSQHGLIDADQTVHRVTLRNLQPGTSYQYRVCSREITTFEPYKVIYGDTAHSDTLTFTTLDNQKNSFSFVVLNDIHERNAILVSLMKLAESKPYDLVFLNGDILGHIENEPQIIEHVLKPCTDLFASHIPFIYVRGNHETRGRFARRLPEYIGLPDDRYYYAFDHGPVRFVVLDSGEDKFDSSKEYSGLVDFDRYRDIQQEWLEQEIQSEAFRQAPFRVVLVHMPPEPSEHWHGPMDIYNKWRPVLNQGRIDLMISGHTHRYTVEMPQPGVRDYPRIIGGGPKAGEATLIRVNATPDTLDVTMTRDDGQVVGTCRIKSRAGR